MPTQANWCHCKLMGVWLFHFFFFLSLSALPLITLSYSLSFPPLSRHLLSFYSFHPQLMTHPSHQRGLSIFTVSGFLSWLFLNPSQCDFWLHWVALHANLLDISTIIFFLSNTLRHPLFLELCPPPIFFSPKYVGFFFLYIFAHFFCLNFYHLLSSHWIVELPKILRTLFYFILCP